MATGVLKILLKMMRTRYVSKIFYKALSDLISEENMITIRNSQGRDAESIGRLIAETYGKYNLDFLLEQERGPFLGPFQYAWSMDEAHIQIVCVCVLIFKIFGIVHVVFFCHVCLMQFVEVVSTIRQSPAPDGPGTIAAQTHPSQGCHQTSKLPFSKT